jgi:ribonucleoside-diphosphate reductase alpha chain
LFVDTCNNALPQAQKDKGLKVVQSNLCSEITLPTTADRTAVCCLSSLNALYYNDWKNNDQFFEDVFRFLDNVLQSFIETAPPEMARAVYSATQERAIGLGLMGFHSFLQDMSVPFEGAVAKSWNNNIFRTMRTQADRASQKLAGELGSCPDVPGERFSHKLAVAPTASISIICGGVSAGIEPIPANIYTHKTLSGSFTVKNPALDRLLHQKAVSMFDQDHDIIKWVGDLWTEILESEGSVAGLSCLDEYEKAVFRTSFEIDQRWIIEHAADRAPLICQAQSVNIFLPADVNKYDLLALHWSAWEKGLKSLYYCRSKSVQRASVAGKLDVPESVDYEECLSCQ